MHRLLIVDDEPIIANGLAEVLSEVFQDQMDIGRAHSAEEALEWMQRTRIDILLSDICMPGMDGLQLLAHVQERWPDCRVIFLTGHSEFDYVYTAIRYPGVRYLLKTEGYKRIIAAIRETAAAIDESFRKDALLKEARVAGEKAQMLLQEQYLGGVLRGAFHEHEINAGQFAELGVPLDAALPVLMLVARVENLRREWPWTEKNRKLFGIRQIAESYFAPMARLAAWLDGTTHLVWLLQPPAAAGAEVAWASLRVSVRGQAELVQRACQETFGIEVSFVLDTQPAGWLDVPERLPALKMLLNYRIGRDLGLLVADGAVEPENKRPAQAVREEGMRGAGRLTLLAEHLEYGRREEFEAELQAYTQSWRLVRSLHDPFLTEQYMNVALLLLSHVNRWGLVERVAFRTGMHKLMQADAHGAWTHAATYLRHFAGILFEIQQQERDHRATDVTDQILRHIQENLHRPDELTLVRLAELARLNPSYLSRLFKQVTGATLSAYIGEARIRKAKELLEHDDIRIHGIAELLGYGTATNFTRFFRKEVGLTPQEYRERQHGGVRG